MLLRTRVESSFNNPAENFLPGGLKNFAQFTKMIKKIEVFQQKNFPSNFSDGHVECSFDDPPKIFPDKRLQILRSKFKYDETKA